MSTKRYSRLASIEEKKNIRAAYYYSFFSIVAIVLLIFLGIPMLVKFAGFVGDIAKSDKPVEINDTTPPAPPQFEEITEYTNNEILEIKGKSESGATITIRSNNEAGEVIANSDGIFTFTFNLNKGENSISASAKDGSGNESTQTKTFRIVYDNDEPKLEISSPADGASYFGVGQRQLTIKGTVDEVVNLTINGRTVAVKDDDTFSYSTVLSEGENKFDIVAMDPSGNESSTSLTINFSL